MRAVEQSTILVTGSTDGLGKLVARELAAAGARVLLHGRDQDRCERTLRELREETGSERLAWYLADLASLEQVGTLARQLLEREERLDVLVNNAGLGPASPDAPGRRESADGYELRLAVNYVAPFLLSRLLEPILERSAPARIVNVTSLGQAPVDFDDLMLERSYDGTQAYCQSKLALIMFTFDLAERLRSRGVTVNCLHPGTFMPTKMVDAMGVTPVDTLDTGIRSTLRLIAAPELDGVTGEYFDRFEASRANNQAYDGEARRKLWALSEELVAPFARPA